MGFITKQHFSILYVSFSLYLRFLLDGADFCEGKKLSFTLQLASCPLVIHNRLQIEINVTPLIQH